MDNLSCSPVTRRVFVLGPSHHVHIKACAVSTANSFDTPIGALKGDNETVENLLQKDGFEPMKRDVDENEHSIEVSVYLRRTLLFHLRQRNIAYLYAIHFPSSLLLFVFFAFLVDATPLYCRAS